MLICPKCRTIYSSTALASCYRDGERLVDYARYVALERDPLRGRLFGGKYRLVEPVGYGGMGTVYRALQPGHERQVAVKVLKRELTAEPSTIARFQREANALSLLTHPNTVRVIDFGQTEDGLLYLVMELLEGEPITAKMMRDVTLDVLTAVRMTQQMLRSLGEAHSKAIVHRDLKPDNVFIARMPGQPEPIIKVLDFGIAKMVAPDRRLDQFETQAGTVFGTPRYMSPEQAQGAALDGRSDLYSVGILLYEMLTGRAPFTDDDAVVVMAKHIQETPESPHALAPDRPIPRSLNDLVMRALAKDPGARFQEAAEFDRALEACVPEITSARTAELSGEWSPHPKPRRRVLYGACAMALIAAGYFGVRVYAKLSGSAQQQRTEERAIESAEDSSKRSGPSERTSASDEPRESAPVHVSLQSQPSGAAVFRDGKRLGETPLRLRLRPDEELVRVELRLSGYQPLAAELAAKDGSRTLALTPTRSKRSRRPSAESSKRSQPSGTSSGRPRSTATGGSGSGKTPSRTGQYERFE